jgi:hypothetical protein
MSRYALAGAALLAGLGFWQAACSGCSPMSNASTTADAFQLDANALAKAYSLDVHAPEQTCGGVCTLCGEPTLTTHFSGKVGWFSSAVHGPAVVRVRLAPSPDASPKDVLAPALPYDVVLDLGDSPKDFTIDVTRACTDGEECSPHYDLDITRVDPNPDGIVQVELSALVDYPSSPDGSLAVSVTPR